MVCAGTGPGLSAQLGIDGTYRAILRFMDQQPRAYYMRKEWVAGRLPAVVRRSGRLTPRPNGASQNSSLLAREWEQLTHHYQIEYGPRRERAAQRGWLGAC